MYLKRTLMVVMVLVSLFSVDTAPARIGSDLTDSIAAIRPLEVRMRRLHRVRPDLMHFPIQYDIIC